MPALADEDRLRVFPLDRFAEPPPEVVRDLVRDVQPPAVDAAFAHPVQSDAQQVFLHLLVARVPLGHVAARGKALVVAVLRIRLVAADDEPIVISGRPAFFQNVLKLRAQHTAMIDHRVQHDLHAAFVRPLHKLFQIGGGAEHLIHPIIIDGIVLVIARRREHGREIERGDAQIAQIPEFFRHAFEIAAVKALCVGDLTPTSVDIRSVFLPIPAAKPIDKDLIEHRAIAPIYFAVYVRCVDIGMLKKIIIAFLMVILDRETLFRVIIRLFPVFQIKYISGAGIGHRKRRRIIIVQFIRIRFPHRKRFSFRKPVVLDRIDERYAVEIAPRRAETDAQLVLAVGKRILGFGDMQNSSFIHEPPP